MQKSEQKLIILYGSHNTGKTFIYNLFRKEGNYICLDFFESHFRIEQYRKDTEEQLGEVLIERFKDIISSDRTFEIDYFFKEVGFLMKQLPDYNFVIKPGNQKWITDYENIYNDWNRYVKEFTPLKIENIIHLHAIRHPRICLATCYDHNTNIKDFIYRWVSDYEYFKNVPDFYHIIKIEDMKDNELMKGLLKNTNLDNIKTFTDFDLNKYRTNIFKRLGKFQSDLRTIDLELKEMLKYLNYDIEDVNTTLYLDELRKIKRPEHKKPISFMKKIKISTPSQLEAAKHRHQKLIVVSGLTNGGKTLVFNLLRKESNFIAMDISNNHYFLYKDEIYKQLGEDNAKRLEPHILSEDIFFRRIFFREIGHLMKQFPNKHFVIKPGFDNWLRYDEIWDEYGKPNIPTDQKNVHNIFVVRHPNIAWATSTFYKTSVDDFISRWINDYTEVEMQRYELIRVEDVKHNKLLQKLVTRTDLDKVKTYTKFDLQVKLANDYTNFEKEIEKIKVELKPLRKFLNYDEDDENVELYLNDELSEEDAKINWVFK